MNNNPPKNQKISVVAVAGPTASGKSALAVRLCEIFDGELVSCDSMQIYRGMDIGTAKPSAKERETVSHHLIDICDPYENFSVADFTSLADRAIRDITARGHLPVLCGGTGLYLDSVLHGIDFGKLEPDSDYRAGLWQLAETAGVDALHRLLEEADPDAAAAIHPNNVKRVIRALEIIRASGMTKTEWDRQAVAAESPYRSIILALDYREREHLYERIDRRVELMISAGLPDEVRRLRNAGYLVPGTTAAGAIGYKELLAALDGMISLEEAVTSIKTATRHYAKRQLTWLRRNPEICWLYPDDYSDSEKLCEAAQAIIRRHLL